jgi:predicted nuclease with TOPRIM domain
MKEQQKMIEQLKTENSTLTASKTQNDAKVEDLSKQMSALTDMVKSLLSKESSATKAMSEK